MVSGEQSTPRLDLTLAFFGGPRRWFYSAPESRGAAIKQAMRRLRRNGGGRARLYVGNRLVWQRGKEMAHGPR
jgi:hypothetical protein